MLDSPALSDLIQAHAADFDAFLDAHPDVAKHVLPGVVAFARTFVYWLHDEGRIGSDEARSLLVMLRSFEAGLLSAAPR